MQSKTHLFKNNLITVIIALYLVVPILFTFIYSLFKEWTDILPTGFTLSAYAKIFSDPKYWETVWHSLILSIIPTVLCALVIILAMYYVTVYNPAFAKVMQIVCTIPYAVQGVIIAIAILSLYANAPGIFSSRLFMICGTYCICILPYMYSGIKNSLDGINAKMLIDAAEMLGCGRFYAYCHVIVPNIIQGITISSLLSLAILFGDFVMINILAGNYFTTTQIYLYQMMKKSGTTSCAITVVLFCITFMLTAVVQLIQNKNHAGIAQSQT